MSKRLNWLAANLATITVIITATSTIVTQLTSSQVTELRINNAILQERITLQEAQIKDQEQRIVTLQNQIKPLKQSIQVYQQ